MASGDLLQYWSSSIVWAAHKNPYAVGARQTLLASFGASESLLYVPPPVLFVFSWLRYFEYPQARFLWMFLSVVSLGVCVLLLARNTRLSPIGWIAIVFFPPSLHALMLGQISPLPLLAFVAFACMRSRNPFCAGMLLALTSLRMQLFVPLYFCLLFERRWRLLLGGLAAGVVLLWAMPLLIEPNIYGLYYSAMRRLPLDWQNPVLGAFLQEWINPSDAAWRFLPQSVGIPAMLLVLYAVKRPPDYERLILPLCLVVSPYAWSYDFVFLLPGLAMLAAAPRWHGVRLDLLVLGMSGLLLVSLRPNWIAVWYSPVILILGAVMQGGTNSVQSVSPK